MEIRVRQRDEVVILDIRGRIDVDAAHFVEVVGQCIRDGYTDILCNMDEVDFIDYMGISVVMIAYKDVANHQGRMKFVNVPVHLTNLLSVTGLDKVIDIYAAEEQAFHSFKEDKAIENIKNFGGTAGVFSFSPEDHNGLKIDAFAMLTVKGGKFTLLP